MKFHSTYNLLSKILKKFLVTFIVNCFFKPPVITAYNFKNSSFEFGQGPSLFCRKANVCMIYEDFKRGVMMEDSGVLKASETPSRDLLGYRDS